MPTNDFVPFCPTDNGSNLLSQADYLVDPQLAIGNAPGIARLKLVNKALRQATYIASGFAQYLLNKTGDSVLDDENMTNLQATIVSAFSSTFTAGLVATAHIQSASGLTWNNSNTSSLGAFSTNVNTPTTVIDLNPTTFGTASTANGQLPQFTITNLVAGYYQVTAQFTAQSSGSGSQTYAISDGVNTVGVYQTNASTSDSGVSCTGIFHYTSTATQTFSIYGADVGGNTQLYNDTAQGSYQRLSFIVTKIG